jgi:hypothetical protein
MNDLTKFGVNPTSFVSLTVGLKITGVVPQNSGQILCSSFSFASHVEVCVLHSLIFLIAAEAFL